MLKELIKLADFLDSKGLQVEADYLDALIKRAEGVSAEPYSKEEKSKLLEIIEYFVGKNTLPNLKRNIIKGHIHKGSTGNVYFKEKDLEASLDVLVKVKDAFDMAKDDYTPPLTDDDIYFWMSEDGALLESKKVEPFLKAIRTSFGLKASAGPKEDKPVYAYADTLIEKRSHSIKDDETECEQDLDKEVYYFENLSKMLKDIDQEDDSYDMEDT